MTDVVEALALGMPGVVKSLNMALKTAAGHSGTKATGCFLCTGGWTRQRAPAVFVLIRRTDDPEHLKGGLLCRACARQPGWNKRALDEVGRTFEIENLTPAAAEGHA